MDPLSVEAQQMMLDRIKADQVNQNLANAQEYMPEAFGKCPCLHMGPTQCVFYSAEIVMLYVKVEVNQNPILAFVDSGAQMTIMSEACAKRYIYICICQFLFIFLFIPIVLCLIKTLTQLWT